MEFNNHYGWWWGGDDGDDSVVGEARAVKAELCRVRSEEVEPFVSKSCYRSSARLLDQGHTSWQDLP